MRATASAWGITVLVTALALSGCVPGAPAPVPTSSPATSASAQPGAETPTPAPRDFDPDGTADDNLPYFDDTNNALIAAGGPFDGRSFIDNLVNAGFSKSAMEVTADRTTVNAQADQLQFAVRINGTCLIGQYGGGAYNSQATTLLATGRCLIGATRPIDW